MTKQLLLTISLLFCLQTTLCVSKMTIIRPEELAVQFPDHSLTLHSSAIGSTPKDTTIAGLITLGDPYDGCSQLKQSTVKPVPQNYSSFAHEFILLGSGSCANSAKAANVYDRDGYVAIITKDNNTQIEKHGSKIKIPVLEISSQDAFKIKAYQQEHPSTYIVGVIEFTKTKKSNKTQVQVWMSATDTDAYTFLANMSDFYQLQPDKFSITPHYYTSQKNSGGNKDNPTHYIGCLSSGRYCAPQPQYQSRIQGKQVIEEDLRQLVIFKNYNPQIFYNYIKYYLAQCLSDKNLFLKFDATLKCSEKCMLRAGLNVQTVSKLYRNSFSGQMAEIAQNDYLLEERQFMVIQKIDIHPQILINGKPFSKGQLQSMSDNVKYQICRKQFPNYSKTCQQFGSDFAPLVSGDTAWILVVTLLVLAVFMGLSMLVYKIILRRKMKREIQSQVNRTLEQFYNYTKLHSQKQKQQVEQERQMKQIRPES